MLLQLYLATSNLLTHSLDSNRLHAPAEEPLLEQLRALPDAKSRARSSVFSRVSPGDIWAFIQRQRLRTILAYVNA